MARHVIAAALAPLFAAACSDYEVTEHTFTERFEQPAISSSADVLFVIDDSASMSEEQVKLASNFQSFVDVLEGTYADYQIGVVTTDVSADDAGALRGGIMTPDTPDLADALLAALDVGDDGDVDERGFDAARLALFSGLNPGFVRGDARLNVVFFSDDDDHSDDEIVNYVHEYDTLAGGGGGAAHAIAGALPAGCVGGDSAAGPSWRYVEAAQMSGGYLDSICADDYTEILTRIGLDLSGLADTFPLNDLPDPSSLVVEVDAVIIPEREIDGWTYSSAQNAIVFHGYAVPRPGMEIVVTYELLAGGTGAEGGAGGGSDTGG